MSLINYPSLFKSLLRTHYQH